MISDPPVLSQALVRESQCVPKHRAAVAMAHEVDWIRTGCPPFNHRGQRQAGLHAVRFAVGTRPVKRDDLGGAQRLV